MIKNKKFLKKLFIASLAVGSFAFVPKIYNFQQITSIAHAEVKEYIGIGEYIMSGKETPEAAIENAKIYAQRNACEQAGFFLTSYSKSKNGILEKDEIEIFTAGILKVINTNTEEIPLKGEASGWIKYRVTLTANIDTNIIDDSISRWMKKSEEDRSKAIAENNTFKKIIDEQREKISKLERDLNNVKSIQNKKRIKEEFESIEKLSAYLNKLREGALANENDKVRIYTEAIKINPNGAEAYFWLALQLNGEQEISYLSKAIEIKPNYADAYYFRANTYYLSLHNYELAIADYTKVIELNSGRKFESYESRANCYKEIGNYEKAIADYIKTIENKPNKSLNYLDLANCYFYLNSYENAINYYIKALKIINPNNINNPKLHVWYDNLATCYMAIGDSAKAREAYMMSM
ncbi:MAG: tetratricopeptide repeat protein [Selenomonadaceae bacterium]|nr:tetratricopeptide repeat protein [Selenomonadaceae bacterium]